MMNSTSTCNQEDQLHTADEQIAKNQRRTLGVVILSFSMMLIEVVAGHLTGSMALLADGYHMASHVGALGISYYVYRLSQSKSLQARLNFGTGKLLPLGGYSSALALGIMAIWMIFESFQRFMHPETIHFTEALYVAVLGLVVNLASAFMLGWKGHSHDGHDDHHDHHDHKHDHAHDHHGHDHHHHHHDHNHESALAHILADALTSVLAIIALVVGSYYGVTWLDPIMGLVGAFVIMKWAYGLCKKTAWELLDGTVKNMNSVAIQEKIRGLGLNLHDFHLWKTGPANYVCIVSLSGAQETPREKIRSFFPGNIKLHLIIENT